MLLLAILCLNLSLHIHAKTILSLDESIARALEENFEIRIEEMNPQNAQDRYLAELGEFLPFFFTHLKRSGVEEFQNSIDFASRSGIRRWEEDVWDARSGVGGLLPTGATYELYVSVFATENSLNSAAPSMNALFRPEVETFAGVKISQPLLRNFGWSVNTAGLRVAKIEVEVSNLAREILVNNKVLEVVDAYLNTLYAFNDQLVKQEGLELAQQFLEMTREFKNVGKAADIDIAQAEMNVSEAREGLVLSTHAYRGNLIELYKRIRGAGNLTGELPEIELPSNVFLPTEEINCKEWVTMALARRADLRAAEESLKQASIRSELASNQRLPELNLEVSYGLNGFGGSAADSFDVLATAEEPAWTLGLTFRMPLVSMRESAVDRIARRRAEQASLTLEMRRAGVSMEVRRAFERINLFRERLETARDSVRLADRLLGVETERFRNGKTSSFAILEAQGKLTGSRTRELAAKVELKKAMEELWAVSGVLLEKHGFLLKPHGRE